MPKYCVTNIPRRGFRLNGFVPRLSEWFAVRAGALHRSRSTRFGKSSAERQPACSWLTSRLPISVPVDRLWGKVRRSVTE